MKMRPFTSNDRALIHQFGINWPQAHRQEMKWGAVFCLKSGKWGVFFGKK